MNCQDISRIVDTGSIRQLSEAQYDAAESHASACRDCAAIWGVQSRLTRVLVPATPPEVAMRFEVLACLPERPVRGAAMRRLTVIGSLVALAAAAAGMWMWLWADSHAPQPAALVVAAAPAAAATPQPALEPAAPATESQQEASAPPFAQLPLVPEPAALTQDPDQVSLALWKAVDRHPELVEGPELDDASILFVSLAMRADGTVLNSAAELASPATSTEVSGRLQRILPVEAGETLVSFLAKGQQLPGGGTARARVFFRGMIIRDSFDLARSDVRVREILGHKYDDLGLPHTSDESNMVTVFLSEDGRILREKVDRLTLQNSAMVLGTGVAVRREDVIASRLGIDAQQIGAIGMTTLEQGNPRVVIDQDGFSRLEGRRAVTVRYAWERRSGEAASASAPDRAPEDPEDFDVAAALVVVKHLFSDAFSRADPAPTDLLAPMPTVVFTARGEVIRHGRVQMRMGVPFDKLLQEQLVPGIRTGLDRTVRLTDKTGATALVHFAWERPR
jgi:hypothetical protein